jgi:hypothetical protein
VTACSKEDVEGGIPFFPHESTSPPQMISFILIHEPAFCPRFGFVADGTSKPYLERQAESCSSYESSLRVPQPPSEDPRLCFERTIGI